jgi:protein-L-isoaspartate(D-aspartate) O-methyltransferase
VIAKKKTIEEFFNGLDRKLFLKEENKQYSHYNQSLPIGFGQTISQPSLVLEMSKLLLLDSNCRVLEIGTGSGYQTVFLAEDTSSVFTVEWRSKQTVMMVRFVEFIGEYGHS